MQLRRWQQRAMDLIVEIYKKGQDKAMVAACPGAGKTAFTISLLKGADFAPGSDVKVVVVPSRALKRQWRKAFKAHGIGAMDDVANEVLERRAAYVDELMFDPARPVHIYTYAQVASNPEIFRILCARHQVVAVFDEVHHADDDAAFGNALVTAFEQAVFKLSLSGTPFNTKGGRLAFCEVTKVTDDEGRDLNKTLVDFEYSYGQALQAQGTADDPFVVRSVQFVRWNGLARWKSFNVNTGQETEHTATGARKTDPLSPMVEMGGDYPKKMIDAALAKVMELRETHPTAGMLITAMSKDHCQDIVDYLNSRGVNDVSAIMHDTPNAEAEIDRWAKGDERVLVAIKMISEGVDIKRLRVGVYLSQVLTQMFFVQFVGRFIRWDDSLDAGQFASVYIPEHVTLIKYALDIEKMVTEAEDQIGQPGEGGEKPQSSSVRYGLSSDGDFAGLIENSREMPRDRAKQVADLLASLNLKGRITELVAEKIIDGWGQRNPSYALPAEPVAPESSLAKMNDRLVTAVVKEAQKSGGDWSFKSVNAYANKAVGIQNKDAMTSDEDLQKRLDVLKELLVRVRRGEVTA